MDFFQEGIVYNEVSSAEVENIATFFDRGANAIMSSSALDWNRNDINRMRLELRKLKEELRYVLNQQRVPITSVEAFRHVFNDDVVPMDTVADTSDKTDYAKVRYANIPMPAMNELNELVRKNSGATLNRIMNLLMKINFLRLRMAKTESDSKNKESALKEFEQKRKSDPGTFERMRDQMYALSEMQGYAEALLQLVWNYPEVSASDQTIRAVAEQFDLMCWRWRRYSDKLYKSLDDYMEKYVDILSEPLTPNLAFEAMAQRIAETPENLARAALGRLKIQYNKETQQLQIQTKSQEELISAIKVVLENEATHPRHYTQIGSGWQTSEIRKEVSANLVTLSVAITVLYNDVEAKLVAWSGGKAKISSNPAVAKVINRAREMVASPVKKTITDPMTRDSFLTKTLIDFKATGDKIKEIRKFCEQAPDVIREKLAKRAESHDREFLRKIFLRRSMPVKDNMRGVAPVEDAVRERVRKRYGPNVPFEDEVNVGTDDKPVFMKESMAEQDTKTGRWMPKSSKAVDSLKDTISQTDVNSSDG